MRLSWRLRGHLVSAYCTKSHHSWQLLPLQAINIGELFTERLSKRSNLGRDKRVAAEAWASLRRAISWLIYELLDWLYECLERQSEALCDILDMDRAQGCRARDPTFFTSALLVQCLYVTAESPLAYTSNRHGREINFSHSAKSSFLHGLDVAGVSLDSLVMVNVTLCPNADAKCSRLTPRTPSPSVTSTQRQMIPTETEPGCSNP